MHVELTLGINYFFIFLWQVLAYLFFQVRIFTVFRKKNLKYNSLTTSTSVLTIDSENINRFNLENILFTLKLEIRFAHCSVEGNKDILLI